jgi:S-DNA-T family DNA segregation ATPase FtsK/SpoIIIE
MNNKKMEQKIARHYKSHSVPIKLTKCEVIGNGERYIYTIKLKPGTKESLIFDRAQDIKTALQLPLFQPFREGLSICIAVSEQPITENSLQKMLESQKFHEKGMWIPIALGYDLRGTMHFADLAKFPHSLYGGATNSGKTVGLRSLIVSIIAKQSVNRVNLLIIDTGASGLDLFNSLPHLSCPIVKDTETAVKVMLALTAEMELRTSLPHDELRLLPAIVCIVDEYVSLITSMGDTKDRKALTDSISSLLRKGRHAKIHMVLATQESAKQDMLINCNNINARMAFTCSDFYSSRSILGEGGAEKLPGKGTMLFKSFEHPKPLCLQGPLISTQEIEQLILRILSKPHNLKNKFVITDLEMPQSLIGEPDTLDKKTTKLENSNNEMVSIILWTLGRKDIAAYSLKQRFHMGNRAVGVLDQLFKMKLIAAKFANQPRVVIPQRIEDVPDEVMKFLFKNGVSIDNIAAAIQNRGCEQ